MRPGKTSLEITFTSGPHRLGGSRPELLGDGAFGQGKAGIVEKPKRDVVRLFYVDPRHMPVFGAVGTGAHRTEIALQHLQAYLRPLAKKRAAPAARPER